MKYLLDTHILLRWTVDSPQFTPEQKRVLEQARPGNPLLVADVTLWEVGMLYELGRIALDLPVREWLERAVAGPLVRVCPITPAVAADVATFPPSFHRDPADRLIVATARVEGATLLTWDARIIASGLVSTL